LCIKKEKRLKRMNQSIKTALIFAGAKSTRMGKDKALLPFGKYNSLAAFQYHKLSTYFDKVYLSAKENKFDFPCEIIQDKYEIYSPLVGIISAFESLEEEAIFILAVDAPFVNENVISTLLSCADKSDANAIVAQSPHGVQPLCGVYKKSIVSLAKIQLKKGNHKLQDLLTLGSSKFIYFEDDDAFRNLNYPQEYQEALSCLKK